MKSPFKKVTAAFFSFALTFAVSACSNYLEEFQDEYENSLAGESNSSGDIQNSDDDAKSSASVEDDEDSKSSSSKKTAKSSSSKEKATSSSSKEKTNSSSSKEKNSSSSAKSSSSAVSSSSSEGKSIDVGKCPKGGYVWYGNLKPADNRLYVEELLSGKQNFTFDNGGYANLLQVDSVCIEYNYEKNHTFAMSLGYDNSVVPGDTKDWWHVSISNDRDAVLTMIEPGKLACSGLGYSCINDDGSIDNLDESWLEQINSFVFGETDEIYKIVVYSSKPEEDIVVIPEDLVKCPSGGEVWYGSANKNNDIFALDEDYLFYGVKNPFGDFYFEKQNKVFNMMDYGKVCVEYDAGESDDASLSFTYAPKADEESNAWFINAWLNGDSNVKMIDIAEILENYDNTCFIQGNLMEGDACMDYKKSLITRINSLSTSFVDKIFKIVAYPKNPSSISPVSFDFSKLKEKASGDTLFVAKDFNKNYESREFYQVSLNGNLETAAQTSSDVLRYAGTRYSTVTGKFGTSVSFTVNDGLDFKADLESWGGVCLEVASSGNFEVVLTGTDNSIIGYSVNLNTLEGPELKCLEWSDFWKDGLGIESLDPITDIRVVPMGDGEIELAIRNIYSYPSK